MLHTDVATALAAINPSGAEDLLSCWSHILLRDLDLFVSATLWIKMCTASLVIAYVHITTQDEKVLYISQYKKAAYLNLSQTFL